MVTRAVLDQVERRRVKAYLLRRVMDDLGRQVIFSPKKRRGKSQIDVRRRTALYVRSSLAKHLAMSVQAKT